MITNRIKELMNALGMSVNSLSKKIGLPQTTLDNQLRGVRKMSLATVEAILAAFDTLSAEWLLRGKGEMFVNNSVNKYLRDIAAMTGIKHRITFYSARKSFAQHAYDLGVPLSTIEYCMGQKMKEDRPIFAYVKVMKKHADVCIRQVLDNIKK